MQRNDPSSGSVPARPRSSGRPTKALLAASLLLAAGSATALAQSETKPAASQAPAAPTAPPAACVAPEHRQFDFWIGDWDVRDAEGTIAGTNRIERILGGCVLQVNWQGGSMTGKSFNMFNEADGKWHQTWVDDRGARLDLAGGIEDGKMIQRGEAPSRKEPSKLLMHQLTWEKLDGDRVLQTWTLSADGGKTWQTVFQGTYSHKS